MLLKNLYDYLKVNYPNVYIIIISGLITTWFYYFTQITNHFLATNDVRKKIFIFTIVTLLLYLGDGSLSELYSFEHVPALNYQDEGSSAASSGKRGSGKHGSVLRHGKV